MTKIAGSVELRNVLNKCLNYYEEARKSDPAHPLVALGFANSAFFAERQEIVDQIFQQSSVCLAGVGRALMAEWWFQRGRLRHSKGDTHGASSDYTFSLQCDPQHLAARFCLAQSSLSLGNPKDAEKHLQILVRWCPKYADAYKLLAYTTLLLGDAELALVSTGGSTSTTTQTAPLSAEAAAEKEVRSIESIIILYVIK